MSKDDLEEATDLCRDALEHHRLEKDRIEGLIFSDPDYERGLALALTDRRRILGLMIGVRKRKRCFTTEAGKRIAWLNLFAVRKEVRRQGIASDLLAEMEKRLRGLGVREVRIRSNFCSGLDLRYREAVVFLLKNGFCKMEDIYDQEVNPSELTCDTSGQEARLASAGIQIARMKQREKVELVAWLQDYFPNWKDVAEEPQRAPGPGEQRGPQVFLARKNGGIIGFAAWSGSGFGPIGVEPAYRLHGTGRVLLLKCLAQMKQAGVRNCHIGWSNYPFYARAVGARISGVFWHMQKML